MLQFLSLLTYCTIASSKKTKSDDTEVRINFQWKYVGLSSQWLSYYSRMPLKIRLPILAPRPTLTTGINYATTVTGKDSEPAWTFTIISAIKSPFDELIHKLGQRPPIANRVVDRIRRKWSNNMYSTKSLIEIMGKNHQRSIARRRSRQILSATTIGRSNLLMCDSLLVIQIYSYIIDTKQNDRMFQLCVETKIAV